MPSGRAAARRSPPGIRHSPTSMRWWTTMRSPDDARPHPRHAMTVPESAHVPAPPRRSVLVIDDDASLRAAVRRFLEREGYEVVESTSGRDALARLREGTAVELLVTDLKMKDG